MDKETPTNDSVDDSAQAQGNSAENDAEVARPVMEPGDFVRISARYVPCEGLENVLL